jgi:NADH-quinone oxidoreductase subunit N
MTDFLTLMQSELALTLILFILLIVKIGSEKISNESLLGFINVMLIINLVMGISSLWMQRPGGTLFSGMFVTNSLILFEKNILNLGILIISLSAYDWLKNHKHLTEFFMLLIACVIGMFFMISSGNFLIFYLSLELATIPLAAMCNYDMDKRISSEAAMKMIMSSAFSSGILLFGISMMYGTTGTISFAEVAQRLDGSHLQIFAFILLFTGFAFKLSIVPFHLWTADVYEGAPVAVTSFLSVISKGSIVFIFITTLYNAFRHYADLWYNVLFLSAIITMTLGNFFALRQQNMKRLLAFSSISQVGFILIGISGSSSLGTTSAVYFILIYVFSNLGAFGVVQMISTLAGKERIEDYKGLYKTNPFLSWILTLSLFSLAGIPPTAGFFGKLFLLTAGASQGNYVLITIAALNMIVSLYYYLKVVRAMFMDANENPVEKIKGSISANAALIVCAVGIVVVGLMSSIYKYISDIANFGF